MAGKLRITAGALKGRKIVVPEEADEGLVRPVTDKIREAVFSSLGFALRDAKVLDIFAGSGAYGFEALSRGASKVLFVEKSSGTKECIVSNARLLAVADKVEIKQADALKFVESKPKDSYDLVFLDPPFPLELEAGFFTVLKKFLAPDAQVVFRIPRKRAFEIPEGYEALRDKNYGISRVLFLAIKE